MQKLWLKFKKSGLFLAFVVVLSVAFLINLLPGLVSLASRTALISTKVNLTKSVDIISCFKKENNNFNKTDLKIGKNSDKNNQTDNNQDDSSVKGEIIRKQYEVLPSKKFIHIGNNAFVSNSTRLPNEVILKANNTKPSFKMEFTKEPQVLIYHTHTTECYETEEKYEYDKNLPTRSRDTKINVVGVGDEIVKQLENRGIKTIHDTKIYDDPAYSGAYDRTNAMIVSYLKKYPKIRVVLDIHRDSITDNNKKRIAPITTIKGKKVAQIMIISGCDNGSNHYKNYEKNLSFACALQKQIASDFPKMARPVSFKYKHYNQSLSPGALLVEIGSQANSVAEAREAGANFGSSLASLLIKMQIEEKAKASINSSSVLKNSKKPTKKKQKRTEK